MKQLIFTMSKFDTRNTDIILTQSANVN